jgi:aspartyl/asparaginyl beta-hydroxylase (cupin superfamily)
MAWNHIKLQVDRGHSECHFVEGDQLFLHLKPYNQTSLKAYHYHKLAPKFYGPYTILKCMGLVAYKLSLPSDSNLHPIFHVSWLKKVIGTRYHIQTNLPELDEEGSIWLHPQTILDECKRLLCQHTIKEFLVQWKDTQPEDDTWELASIMQQFLHLKPRG